MVVFFEADAKTYAPAWIEQGASIKFFEHGYSRLLLFDQSDAIIAYPKDVLTLDTDREYFGFHVANDEEAVGELRNYFQQMWHSAYEIRDTGDYDLGRAYNEGVLRFIEWVIVRALGSQGGSGPGEHGAG